MTERAPLQVAVVGHTNTGKTSLMRTLMRDVDFGEVSDRPAVTRAVESAILRVAGAPALELYDTPGLEDSIGLLEHLDTLKGGRRIDGVDLINAFLASDEARGRYAQEAKAIRQVLASDVALYVIDARDRVLGKHRDELEVLGRCATPVVPVLNFVARDDARLDEWREALARVNMHATCEMDSVVYSAIDERRLFEKMATLLDAHRPALERLIEDRARQRATLVASSAILVAELLVDVAAMSVTVPSRERESDEATDRLRSAVRAREQDAVDQLLGLHRFRKGDAIADDLPLDQGTWGLDLFSPEAMKRFGVRAGGYAATGAMIGLTADLMLGGLSLGTGAGAGAAIGGLLGAAETHGRKLAARLTGRTSLRVENATLRLLAARQIALVKALLARGHASMDALHVNADLVERAGLDGADEKQRTGDDPLARSRTARTVLDRARLNPHWSRRSGDGAAPSRPDPARQDAVQELATVIEASLAPTKSR